MLLTTQGAPEERLADSVTFRKKPWLSAASQKSTASLSLQAPKAAWQAEDFIPFGKHSGKCIQEKHSGRARHSAFGKRGAAFGRLHSGRRVPYGKRPVRDAS